jgi:hypothetical protein
MQQVTHYFLGSTSSLIWDRFSDNQSVIAQTSITQTSASLEFRGFVGNISETEISLGISTCKLSANVESNLEFS